MTNLAANPFSIISNKNDNLLIVYVIKLLVTIALVFIFSTYNHFTFKKVFSQENHGLLECTKEYVNDHITVDTQ